MIMGARRTLLTYPVPPESGESRCHKDLFILESRDPPSLMLYHLLEELPSMVSGTLAHSQRKQEVSGEYRMRRRECVGEGQA